PEGIDGISTIKYANEKLYIIGTHYWEEGEGEETQYKNETKLIVMTLDGAVEKENIISSSDDNEVKEGVSSWRNIQDMAVGSDGNLVSLENVNTWSQDENSEEYFIIKYDSEGGRSQEISLKKIQDSVTDDENSYFYVNSFMPTDDGKYLLLWDSKIFVTDDSGALLNTIEYGAAGDNTYMYGLYKAGDGRILTGVSITTQTGDEWKSEYKLVVIDTAANKFGDEFPVTTGGNNFMNGTDKYDLLINRESGLAGYDIETGESETIIDWLKSGFDTTAMETGSTTALPDGRILCVTYNYQYNGGGGYSWSGDDMVISVLSEVDPETLPDKKLIKMYAMWLDVGVKRQVLEFNKENLEYEIELTCYADDMNWSDALTKMNNDMIAGNIPDVLLVESGMPMDSYIAKGIFANLYDFMETDPEINKEDFLTNLFEAYEVNGALYTLVPDFTVNTMVGKTSAVGETEGWTMEEFIALAEENPDKNIMEANYATNTSMLSNLFSYSYDTFIDRDTGECTLNSDEFIKMMEFCSRFPSEIKDEDIVYDENYWNEQDVQYRDDKTLLSSEYIGRFQVIRELEQGKFGVPVTFKGMPGVKGNGAVFNGSSTRLAISAKAANPEGAWQFVRYFLTDEYQDLYAGRDSYNFPAKLSALEKKAETAKERPYWENEETGEKEYYDNNYYMAGESINIGVNTDEDNERMMNFLKSIKTTASYDSKIQDIITEEAASYFSGQKTAQQAADIIQNRVANYIAENR
ncbi:MAG: extracellular solute-binding protein, partial [Muribaculaceae bacterium]|nr:extracellular solute-binding protein [Muribaculaceae bacterium]